MFSDYSSNIEKVATSEKDWGLSVLLPVEHNPPTQSAPAPTNDLISLDPSKILNFLKFLEDVLRVEFDGFNCPEDKDSDMECKRSKPSQVSAGSLPLGSGINYVMYYHI